MKINKLKQQNYFDILPNQFPGERIMKPSIAQRLEFFHLLKVSGLKLSDEILEIGCGSGRLTIPLLNLGYNVHAVDISESSLFSLENNYKKIDIKNKGKLTFSPDIPKNKKYDAIIGSDILHHINISSNVQKFYSLLKKDGIILFSEPNSWHFPWYIYLIIFSKWEIEKGILYCNMNYLNKILKLSGFREIKIFGHGLIPTPVLNFFPVFARFNALILGNFPVLKFFCFRLLIKAKK